MQNHRAIVLLALFVSVVALMAVSIFAFVFAGSANPSAPNPSSSVSSTNGNYPNNWNGNSWSNMMSGMGSMMGGNWGPSSASQTPATAQSTVLPLVGFGTFIGAAITGAGGLVYYFATPKGRATAAMVVNSKTGIQIQSSAQAPNTLTAYTTISKTLTPEESKVMDVLVAHDGKYLQKYIRVETGLSRLKTHRIVTRLSERGIVTLEKSGNTNEVRLSSWLKPDNERNWLNQNSEEKASQEKEVLEISHEVG